MNKFTPKNHLKSFLDAPRAIKRQLTCPIEFTSGSSLIGRNGILVIPRNHLESPRTLLVTMRVYNNSSFFGNFDGHHKFAFKKLVENLLHGFFSFSQNQIFRYVCLTVQNCRLVEIILDTFCIAQIWYDLSILRMFAVAKCRDHTNFVLSKMYECGHFKKFRKICFCSYFAKFKYFLIQIIYSESPGHVL